VTTDDCIAYYRFTNYHDFLFQWGGSWELKLFVSWGLTVVSWGGEVAVLLIGTQKYINLQL